MNNFDINGPKFEEKQKKLKIKSKSNIYQPEQIGFEKKPNEIA